MDLIAILNQYGGPWAGFMWDGLVWGSVAAVVAWCIWYALRNWVTPQFGYLLFCLVLLKLIIPVGLPILPPGSLPGALEIPAAGTGSSVAAPAEDGVIDPPGETMPMPMEAEPNSPSASSLPEGGAEARTSLSWAGTLLVVWAGLALLGLGRLVWLIRRTRKLRGQARPLDPAELPFSLFDLCEKVGVPRVQFLVSDRITSPAATGFRLPSIILPESLLTSLRPDRLEWTVAHELAHVRRRDLWVALVQEILRALFFFNPAYWIAHTMLNQLREYSCDDEALRASGLEAKQSAETVFDVLTWSQKKPSPMMGIGVSRNTFLIRTRIGRLLDSRWKLETSMSPGAWTVLAAAAVLVFPRPEAYSIAEREREAGEEGRFPGLVTAAPTLGEELERLRSEAEGADNVQSILLSREQPKARVEGRVRPDSIGMIHVHLDGFPNGGLIVANVRMGSEGQGHGRFQWYRVDVGEEREVTPNRLSVIGDLPPEREQRGYFPFGPGQELRLAASVSDAVVDPAENLFEVELEAFGPNSESEPAPILEKLLLTAERREAKVTGEITAPGQGLQDYQLVIVDATAFKGGGRLEAEVTLADGRSAASMDLFPGRIPIPAHPAMQELARRDLRLASQYGVAGIKPMESAGLEYYFDRPAVFQIGVTGDWMSRQGSKNRFELSVRVTPTPGAAR